MCLRVNTCCCTNLRTGGLIIAWSNWILVVLIFGAWFFKDELPSILNPLWYDFIASILLPYGIYKNIRPPMLCWLITKAVFLVVLVIVLGQQLLEAPFSTAGEVFETIISVLLGGAFYGLMVYCWIVMFSLYLEIRAIANRPPTASQMMVEGV
ncbi:uncharacterized protein LOC129921137 [Episyrphus balteatus]|uniref:uncharacterized protein LOC129921137 n=1 Tax=Episyrphus balteatus TaxID=286459 RepID=UPI002484F392|nr:uncharacterized protein LOC129921137 [Episyrphus balteatus]